MVATAVRSDDNGIRPAPCFAVAAPVLCGAAGASRAKRVVLYALRVVAVAVPSGSESPGDRLGHCGLEEGDERNEVVVSHRSGLESLN